MSSTDPIRHQAKILVVDDDQTARLLTRQCLEAENMLIVEASNGFEALDLFVRERPDLVFMDVEMPVMTGLGPASVFGSFRKEQRFPSLSLPVRMIANLLMRSLMPVQPSTRPNPVIGHYWAGTSSTCLLYSSYAADDLLFVDPCVRRILNIKHQHPLNS